MSKTQTWFADNVVGEVFTRGIFLELSGSGGMKLTKFKQ